MEEVQSSEPNIEAQKLMEDGYEPIWIPKDEPAFKTALDQLHERGEVVFLEGDTEFRDQAKRVFFRSRP